MGETPILFSELAVQLAHAITTRWNEHWW